MSARKVSCIWCVKDSSPGPFTMDCIKVARLEKLIDQGALNYINLILEPEGQSGGQK